MARVTETVYRLRAEDRTASAFRSVQRHVNELGTLARRATLGMTALGAAGGVALARMTASGLKSVDALAKMSDRLGIATGQMQALQHAASLTGVSTETLNTGLQRMVRRVSEAAQGTGEAQNAIRELGLDAKALAQLSPDQQFAAIADAMKQVATQGDRVRLVTKIFDSEAAGLVNTMRDGASGLEEIAARMRAYGIAINRVDASKVEQANDAMSELQLIATGLGQQLAINVAPAITGISQELQKMALEGRGVAQTTKDFIDASIGGLAHVLDAWRMLRIAIKAGEGGMLLFGKLALDVTEQFVKGIESAANAFVKQINVMIRASNAVRELVGLNPFDEVPLLKGSEQIADWGDTFSEALHQTTREFTRLKAAAMPGEELLAGWRRVNEEMTAAATGAAAGSPGGAGMGGGSGGLSGAIGGAVGGTFAASDRFAEIQEGLAQVRTSAISAREEGLDYMLSGVDAVAGGFQNLVSSARSLNDRVHDIANSLANTVVNAIADMAKRWIAEQLAMTAASEVAAAASQRTAQAASQGAMNAAGQLAAAWGPAAYAASVATLGGAAITGGISYLGGLAISAAATIAAAAVTNSMSAPGRAIGGPVNGGQSFLVGERGPEIFTPRASGYITPNHRMGGGGETVVQNLTIYGRLTDAEKRETVEVASNIGAQKALRALPGKLSRGGSYRRAVFA